MAMIVPDIIGMPGGMPSRGLGGDGMSDAYPTDTYRAAALSLPILEVVPMTANYEAGVELYKLAVPTKTPSYGAYLESNGIKLANEHLFIACHSLSNPSETYSNSFSPNSIAESISSLGTENVQDLMFMSGTDKLVGDNSLAEALEGSSNSLLSTAGKAMTAAGDMAAKLKESLDSLGSGKIKGLTDTIAKVANHPGSKIDFPLMWRSSNYSASYTITTRLYNPCPADDDMYDKLIRASLGALIALAVPCSEDGDLYHWPFICRCYIPGLFRLRAAYVSNISVSKGGDAMDISLRSKGQMRPNLIDVQLTFNSLYNVLPMTMDQKIEDRPTLFSELDALNQKDGAELPIKSSSNSSNNPDKSSSRAPTFAQQTASIIADMQQQFAS